ncbi:MAG: Eco57I restriction-modification methylase domain-containing protein [Candidatus Thorarchaeota archaeon]
MINDPIGPFTVISEIFDEIYRSAENSSFLNQFLQLQGNMPAFQKKDDNFPAIILNESIDELGRFYQLFRRYKKDTRTPGIHFTPLSLARKIIDETLGSELEELKSDIEKALDIGDIECVESRIKHLHNIRILDPACGSGIFLIAAFQVLWSTYTWIKNMLRKRRAETCKPKLKSEIDSLLTLHFYRDSPNQHAKLGSKIILTHLHGVDLDPIALSIAKVNLWLELIRNRPYDYSIERDAREKVNLEEYFPFLGLNLVVANSLVNLPAFLNENGDLREPDLKLERLVTIKAQYAQNPTAIGLRRSLKDLHREITSKIISRSRMIGNQDESLNSIIQSWRLSYQIGRTASNPFSIIVGNPPWSLIRNERMKKTLNGLYKSQFGQPDLYRYFLELSFALAETKIGFITPNTWLDIPAAQKLRNKFSTDWETLKISRVSPEFFANVAANIIWFAAKKRDPLQRSIEPKEFTDLGKTLARIDDDDFGLTNHSKILGLYSGIKQNTRQLSEISEITIGYQLYHKEIHTPDEIATRKYHSKHPFSEPNWSEIRANSLFRFKTIFKPDRYILKSAKFFRIPPRRFLENQRILIREIPSKEGIVAARTDQTFLCPKAVLILVLTDRNYSYESLLCYLNSRLMQFALLVSGEKARQRLFPRISIRTLSALPVPIKADNSCLTSLCRRIEDLIQEKEKIAGLKGKEMHNRAKYERILYLDSLIGKSKAELDAQVFRAFNLKTKAVGDILEVLQLPIQEKEAILSAFME